MPTYIGNSTLTSTTYTATGGSLGVGGNLSISNNLKISAQPAFNARGGGAFTASTTFGSAGWIELGSAMNWVVTQQGPGSYGFSTSTGRYTAPVSGKYYFHGTMYYDNTTNSTANYIHFLFGKNGSESWNVGGTPYNIYAHGEVARYADGISVSGVIDLSVGDYVSLRPYWAGSGGQIYSDYTLFCGYLIM
jgi:hypothetical protein